MLTLAGLVASVLAAAPALSPELGVEAPKIDAVPFLPGAYAPWAAVWDGHQYVVAWIDGRNGRELRMERISAGGASLDPYGVSLSQRDGSLIIEQLAMVFDGQNYWLTWGETPDQFNFTSYVLRADPSFAPLDPGGRNLGSISGLQLEAFDGGMLLLWGGPTPSGQRFDLNFNAIDASPYSFPGPAGYGQFGGDGAGTLLEIYNTYASGDTYASAWLFDFTGATLAPEFAVANVPMRAQEPLLSNFDGTDFAVLYEDAAAGGAGNANLKIQRVSRSGALVGTPAFIDGGTGIFSGAMFGTMGAQAGGERVLYLDHTETLGTLYVDASGVESPAVGLAFDRTLIPGPLGVTCGPSDCLLQWWTATYDGTATRLLGAVVAGTTVTGPFSILTAAAYQDFPSVAGASPALVAWREARSNGSDLLALRMNQNGAAIDSQPLQVASGWVGSSEISARADGWLVVYVLTLSSTSSILARFIALDGGMSSPVVITPFVSPRAPIPLIANDGATWLTVWPEGSATSGAVLTLASNNLTVTMLPLLPAAVATAVAYDGTNFWVTCAATGTPVQAVHVTAGAQVMETVQLMAAPASVVGSAGFDGGFWVAAADEASPDVVTAVAFSSTGAPLSSPLPVFGPGEPTRLLRLVPYPPSSLLVLQDTNAAKHDVTQVVIVDLDGGVTAWFSVDGGAEPAAAPFDVGRGMLVYRRYDDSPTTQSQRVEVRLYGPRADGAACSVAADCASPFCELGFCCPTACSVGDCHTGTCLVSDGGTDAGTGGGAGGGSAAGGGAAGGGAAGGTAAGGGAGGSPARGPLALRVECGCTGAADGPALLFLIYAVAMRRRQFRAASRM